MNRMLIAIIAYSNRKNVLAISMKLTVIPRHALVVNQTKKINNGPYFAMTDSSSLPI